MEADDEMFTIIHCPVQVRRNISKKIPLTNIVQQGNTHMYTTLTLYVCLSVW